jgi:hypothetical protein
MATIGPAAFASMVAAPAASPIAHTAARVCGTSPSQFGQRRRIACITARARTIQPISGLNASSLMPRMNSAATVTPTQAGGSMRRT